VPIFKFKDGAVLLDNEVRQIHSFFKAEKEFTERWRVDQKLRESYDPVFTDMDMELDSIGHLKDFGVASEEDDLQYERLLCIEEAMINRACLSIAQKSYVDQTYHLWPDVRKANAVLKAVRDDLRIMLDILSVWGSQEASMMALDMQTNLDCTMPVGDRERESGSGTYYSITLR
jgi:hypothetical protein